MLSIIVFCEDRPASPASRPVAELLARTLTSLVPAKIEGLPGEVRIAGPAGKDLSVLASHAGCGLIEADQEAAWLHLALQTARGRDVFLLRCGFAPESGLVGEASDYLISHSEDQASAACLRAVPEGFLEQIFPALAPIAGLIASRDLMLRAPRGSFSRLTGFVAPVTTFHTRARRIR